MTSSTRLFERIPLGTANPQYSASTTPTTKLGTVSDADSPPSEIVELLPLPAQSPGSLPRQERESTWSVFVRAAGFRLVTTRFGTSRRARHRRSPRQHGKEQKKAILEHSRRRVLARSFVHFVPIAASIALTVLNLKGYFIGVDFQGPAAITESVGTLSLQVAAKLMELAVVASVSTILLDIIRHELLFRKEGLPLGLLNSAFAFKDLSFFWSPNLWYGTRAISSTLRKCRLLAIFILSGSLATVAGPSSALLMVPPTREFPGGATDFWLFGNKDSLWPSNLNADAVGGESCLDATAEMIGFGTAKYSGCIWSSTSTITEMAKSLRLTKLASTITVIDGSYRRTVSFRASNWPHYYDTWALSSSYAMAAYSTKLSWIWYHALYDAPTAAGVVSITARLRLRNNKLSVARVSTQLPVVRVRCNDNHNLTFGTHSELDFPLFDYYSSSRGENYNMIVPHVNSSSILTQWISFPRSQLKHPDSQQSYPSAFLTIQVPRNTMSASVYTCSVDARWVCGDAKLSSAGQSSPLQEGVVTSSNGPEMYDLPRYVPINDGTWKQVSIDLDWLYALTPLLNNSASPSPQRSRDRLGWTSLSAMLTAAGFDSSDYLDSGETGWGEATSAIESAIALVVVEGMARAGQTTEDPTNDIYYRNEGETHLYEDEYDIDKVVEKMFPLYDSILRGDSKQLLAPLDVASENVTKAHWSVTVTGFAYKADSNSYYLAIAVLLFYAVAAIAHTVYRLYTGVSSDAWDSFEEILALGYNSMHNHGPVENTSAGIRRGETFQRRIGVRVMEGENMVRGDEEIQLLLDPLPDEGYGKVVCDKVYGNVE